MPRLICYVRSREDWPLYLPPCRSMQTITPIVVVVHLYRIPGTTPFCCTRLQIAFVASFPYSALFAKEDSLSQNASFSTIFRQCATTHKSNSVAAMSATQFEHGVQTTRQPINAAPPVLWRSSLGTLKSIRSIYTPNKKHRLDERCGDCRAPVIHPSWMTRQTKNTRIQT
jgi:hypothetical protein